MPDSHRQPRTVELAGAPMELHLDWGASAFARRLVYLAVAGLGVAVVTRRAELVAFAAPALVALSAWRAPRPRSVRATTQLSARRAYEGEQVAVEVRVEGAEDCGLEVLLHPFDGVQAVRAPGRGDHGGAVLVFQVDRWGRRVPGVVEVVMWDRYRMSECRFSTPLPPLACYPRPALCRGTPALGRLAVRSGDHRSRLAGEGVEFVGVRQYATGDRQRSINWAATTRRGRMQVNTFAAERSQDVVLIVDAGSEVGRPGSTSVDKSLRGALGLARAYLDARDRVGFVAVGQRLLWLAPGMGNRQFFRMTEAILEVKPGSSPDVDVKRLPRAALAPGVAVVAFSPLLDEEFVEALRDLRQRNFSVVVVDVLNVELGGKGSRLDRLARRVWYMERQALMFSLSQLGVPVVAWDGEAPLALPAQRRSRQVAGSRR